MSLADGLGHFVTQAIIEVYDCVALVTDQVVVMAVLHQNIVSRPGALINRPDNS